MGDRASFMGSGCFLTNVGVFKWAVWFFNRQCGFSMGSVVFQRAVGGGGAGGGGGGGTV